MTNTELASVTETQAPGFQRIRIGNLLITALYDGFVPISADEFHGAPRAEINRLLAEAFMPPDGDPRTAVIAFLVQGNGRHVLIDAGSGDTLGHDTGWLAANLAAAHTDPALIDHVLLTHLHPDHAGGLISPDGQALFSRATVAAKADADHWLDPADPEATEVQSIDQRRQGVLQVMHWIEDGTLDVLIDRAYPLEDAVTAHRDLESQQTVCKLLLIR
jgi:glyoxylase-like metal-dependent hydrolase (beta-lactamase superfamily II)